MINKLIQTYASRLNDQRGPSLDRPTPIETVDSRHAGILARLAAARAERHRADNAHLPAEFLPATLPQGWTQDTLDAHLLSGALSPSGINPWKVGPSFFNIILDRVVSPPYDTDWQEGTALAFLARQDGKFTVLASDNAFNAGGIGFNLSVRARREAGITPLGNFTWNSFCVTNQPGIRSRGGLSITVFKDDEDDPVIDKDITLWNVVGVPAFWGIQGGGALATAESLPTAFGPVRLAPAWFTMEPGSNYLVWIWGWHSGAVPTDVGFWAAMNVEVSAVNVDFEPPFVGPS